MPATITVSLTGSLGFVTNRAAHLMRRQFLDRMESENIDLTPEEWIVLATLAERGPQSQNDLAGQLVRDRTTVTRLLDGLVERSLAVRDTDRFDRRVIRAALTSDGKSLARRVMAIARELRLQQVTGIAARDIEITFRTLERVRARLQNGAG